MNSSAKIFLGFLAAVVFGLMAVITVVAYKILNFIDTAPTAVHEERIIEIPRGASVLRIAQLLEQEGVLRDAKMFYYLVRYKGVSGQVKAGEFRFYTDLKPKEVLAVLIKGEEVGYKLTIPEGYRITEMVPVVSTLSFLDGQRFLELTQDPDVIASFGIQSTSLEGFLFPSTYSLTRSQTEKDLVDAMVREFKAYWTAEKEARAHELGMTQLEVVTLASIIEKESAHESERPLVSSVYHNRIKKGMKLQADPTIIYGLKDYDGNIRRADILRAHPWNTYVITGLPPTPIASPGAGSLEAALYPADSDYLYFVARPDRTHDFSRTYAEHERKVYQYQVLPNRR